MSYSEIRRTAAALLSVAFILLAAGCGSVGPDRTVLRSGTRFFPLLHDRELRYVDKNGGVSTPYSLRMVYGGGNLVRTYFADFKGLDTQRYGFVCEDSSVFFVSTTINTPLSGQPEYRDLWVKEPADEGDQWENEVSGELTVVAGYETVTVPAGTFQNCLKTVTTVQQVFMDSLTAWKERGAIDDGQYNSWAKFAGYVTTRWFAQGVGLVKEQLGSVDHVRELTAIVKPGTGLLDLPAQEQKPETK
jgi:hypothetical protein